MKVKLVPVVPAPPQDTVITLNAEERKFLISALYYGRWSTSVGTLSEDSVVNNFCVDLLKLLKETSE